MSRAQRDCIDAAITRLRRDFPDPNAHQLAELELLDQILERAFITSDERNNLEKPRCL